MKSVPEEKYADDFSEADFWEKAGKNIKRLGSAVLLPAIELYVVWKKGKLRWPEKVMILAALGYFVSPADAIPDITPFIGYTDDLSVLMITTYKLFKNMPEEKREEIRYAANHRMRKLFGEHN